MSEISASTDLGNGVGYVYITNDSGTLGTAFGYPQGLANNILAVNAIRKEFGPRNSRSAGAGYAVGYMTLTNAAADNLNTLTIGGVNQISGVVAMTAGNLDVSAAAIAAAVNAFVATPDFRASASGPTVIFTSVVATDAYNGDLIVPAFSGASTATTIPVGGGRSIGSRPYRFFIDARSAAVASSIAGAAVEITDAVSWNDLSAPVTIATGTIASNTLSFQRLNDGSRMQVQIDGVTTANNSLGVPSNRITSIVFEGGCVGDIVLFSGVTGAGAPAVFVNGVDIALELATKSLGDFNDTLEMRYVGAGQFSQVVPNAMDAAALRGQGVAIPLQAGTFELGPAAGTATITPGSTGVSAFPGVIYEQDIAIVSPAVLVGSLNFTIDTTNAIEGDTGTISGNNQAITVGANAVNFSGPAGIVATLTAELALSGQWVAKWTYLYYDAVLLAGIVSWQVTPAFSTTNTQFLTTAMYKDLSVTGAKIDDATIDGATKMIADSIPEVNLDASVRAKLNVQGRTIVPVAIPTGEMLALNTTRKLAVAAPGAGKAVVVTGVYASITYIAPIYATNINLQIISDTATAPQAESSLILVKTTNANVIIPLTTVVGAGETQIIENAAVYITTETGNSTAGASNFTFYVEYMIIDL